MGNKRRLARLIGSDKNTEEKIHTHIFRKIVPDISGDFYLRALLPHKE